jgi:uncharacterized protein YybS (DUF2232 family)
MNSLAVEGMDNGKLPLIFRDIFVLSLLFALPPAGLLLTPAALYLHSRHGLFTGKRIVFCAVVLALPLAWWLSSLSTLFLSATFFVAGVVLARSASRGDGPMLSLGKAALTLAVLWAALLIAASLLTERNIYQALAVFLQSMLREAAQYPAGATSGETQAIVTETLTQAARFVPVVLPAMLLLPALLAPLVAMLLSNAVESLRGLPRRWIDFRLWRLPDMLVWAAIILAVGYRFLDGLPGLVAINALILVVVVYAMQGLAMIKFFFDSRRLPIAAQLVLIFLVVSQAFGLLALAVLGLVEVWADFRRLGRRKPRINHDNKE